MTYSSADLSEGPFRQVASTAHLIEAVYGYGGAGERGDRSAKDAELARLLDFHLRRTAMQQVGSDSDRLRDATEFRDEAIALIATGAYDVTWRETSDGRPLFGLVAHFNAGQAYASASREPELVEGDDGLGLYPPFGQPDITQLLAGECPEGIVDRVDWFTGTFAVPAPPVGTEPTEHPAEVPQLSAGQPAEFARARDAFAGFVGNDEVVRRLLPWIAVAMRESPPRLRENIAFTGPPSTGKTELARRISRALGLPFLTTSGSALRSLDDLLEKMEREVADAGLNLTDVGREGGLPIRQFPPLVVFADEAHEIRRPVQDELLTLLEPQDRRAAGSRFIADVTDVTFILATTEWVTSSGRSKAGCSAFRWSPIRSRKSRRWFGIDMRIGPGKSVAGWPSQVAVYRASPYSGLKSSAMRLRLMATWNQIRCWMTTTRFGVSTSSGSTRLIVVTSGYWTRALPLWGLTASRQASEWVRRRSSKPSSRISTPSASSRSARAAEPSLSAGSGTSGRASRELRLLDSAGMASSRRNRV